MFALLVRIAVALEAIANRPQPEPNQADRAERQQFEALVAGHIAALSERVGKLETRAPPPLDPEVRKELDALRFELDGAKRLLNSVKSKVYRDTPTEQEDAPKAPMPPGMRPLGSPGWNHGGTR